MTVLEIIKELQERRAKANIIPTHVLYIPLKTMVGRDITNELNALYKDGKLAVGRTLNDKYIKIKE